MNTFMIFLMTGGWIFSVWYLFYMKKYDKDGTFIGSIEPKVIFVVTTFLMIMMVVGLLK